MRAPASCPDPLPYPSAAIHENHPASQRCIPSTALCQPGVAGTMYGVGGANAVMPEMSGG